MATQGTRPSKTKILIAQNTITNKIIDTVSRADGYAITWDEGNDRYEHSEVLTAASVTYEQLDSIGDVGNGSGQLLPGDYRFDIEELNLVTDGTTSHIVTLADHYAHTVSPYMANDPVITDNGNGTISISSAEAYMKMGNFGHSPLEVVTVPAIASIAIPLDQNYIVYTDYNGGSPTYAAMPSVAGYFYANWDKLPFATVINIGSKIIINDFSDAPINGVYKNILGQLNYQPIRYLGGLGSVEVGTRQLSVSGGAVLLGNEYNGVAAINTSTGDTFTRMYVTSGTWTRTTGQNTVSNVQYNNTTTGLVTAPALPERWINKWLYYIIDSPSFWILVEGQTLYTSLAAAEAGGVPAVLPPEVSQFYAGSLLVAKIIVSTNQTNIVEIQNPFAQTFQTTAASNHDNLSNINLAGAGVTYGHVTASPQTIAGAKTFSSLLTSPNFVSTVAIGTQPYAATSTTLNTNLNADLLDGQHGSYYQARASHTGTQLAATISDFSASVSSNTDVTANTAARHVAVTVNDSSTIDFTASGTNNQTITASVIQSGLSLINLGEKNLSSLTNAADVQAIEALTGSYGFLKKTAENTWSIDTASYLPLTGGTLTGGLTGTTANFTSSISLNGNTVIDSNRNYTGGSGTFSGVGNLGGLKVTGDTKVSTGTGFEVYWDNTNSRSIINSYGRGTTSLYYPMLLGASVYSFGTGNVGIGYSSGTEITNNKLAVNGSGYFNGNVTANSFIKLGGTSPEFLKADGSTSTETWNITPSGTIDGVNDTFDVGQSFSQIMVVVNGVYMKPTDDYTTSGNNIIFQSGSIPQVGNWIIVNIIS